MQQKVCRTHFPHRKQNGNEFPHTIQVQASPPLFLYPPAPSRCSVTLCAPDYKLSFRTYFPDCCCCCCCPSTCAVSSAALLCNTMLTATPTTTPTPSHAKCNMKAQKNFCLCLKIQNYAASFQKIKKKKEAEEKQLKFWMSPTPPACTLRSTAIQIMKIQKQNCTKLDWKQQPLPLPLPPPPFSVCLSSSLVHPGLARGIIIKCCHKVFPVFHLLLQHRKTKNVMENKIRRPAPAPPPPSFTASQSANNNNNFSN